MHWKQEISFSKKNWGKQRIFIPRLLLLKSLSDTHSRKYLLLFKREKKNNVVFVDTILLLSVENVGFFQGKIVERESHEMISLTSESKVWVLNNSCTSGEVTKIAFRACQTLSKSHLSPPIWVVVEKLPPSVCSQVSPQVFRLGGECFGRWWLEVVLKVGEMGVKRWILNWTDGKALDPC